MVALFSNLWQQSATYKVCRQHALNRRTNVPTLIKRNPVCSLRASANVDLPVPGVPVTKMFGRALGAADISERLPRIIPRFMTWLEAGRESVAGATAGVLARLVVAPLDLLKIRFQLQHHPVGLATALHPQPEPAHLDRRMYTSLLQAIVRITREEGILAFWK